MQIEFHTKTFGTPIGSL